MSGRSIVYVVDDDVSVCRALTLLLSAHGFMVETFTQADIFLKSKHLKVPSCLVLDLQLQGSDGFDLQERMSIEKLSIPIIFISGHGDIPKSVKAILGGAIDFLPKPFTARKLLNAVHRAIEKDKIHQKNESDVLRIQRRIDTLSPRELEVFHFVAKGMLNKQIASKRGTSLQTIKVHRSRVMQKMQAKTVTELIHFAQKAGIPS